MKQLAIAVGLTLTAAVCAQAQRGAARAPDVPRDRRPPAGMCRVWLDNVPAGQQPAPTDCASAVRNRPSNGRVIFGDDYVQPENKRDSDRGGSMLRPFARPNSFAPPQREVKPAEKPARDDRKPDDRKPDDRKPDDRKKPQRPE